MSIRFTFAAAILVAASSANASYSSSVDSDGCWDAKQPRGGKCLQQVNHSWNEKKITVTYKNAYGERIYAKVCQDKTTGSSDCGAFGIRGYSEYKYYTYNASGDVSYNAVGSTNPGQDWVCKDRWNMKVNGS